MSSSNNISKDIDIGTLIPDPNDSNHNSNLDHYLTKPIEKPNDYNYYKYYTSCRPIPIDDLPTNSSIKNYLILHRPNDISQRIYTSKYIDKAVIKSTISDTESNEKLQKQPDNNLYLHELLNQKLTNYDNNLLSYLDKQNNINEFLFTYIIADDYEDVHKQHRVLYMVQIIDAFEYGAKHTQLISHIDNLAHDNCKIYCAGEIQIIKQSNDFTINFNFDSGTFRMRSQNDYNLINNIGYFMRNYLI